MEGGYKRRASRLLANSETGNQIMAAPLTENQKPETGNHIMIAAGGTGGHLYPGLALAEEFRRACQARVSFITTPKQVTLDILRQYDFPWQILNAQALKGTGLGRRLLSLLRLPFSFWQARRLLRREKPQLVVGMGGYISGPVGLAASRLGIPLVIHEQNAILGTTNKLLARLASTIFLSFPQSEDNPAPKSLSGPATPSGRNSVPRRPHPARPRPLLSSSWEAPRGRIT